MNWLAWGIGSVPANLRPVPRRGQTKAPPLSQESTMHMLYQFAGDMLLVVTYFAVGSTLLYVITEMTK